MYSYGDTTMLNLFPYETTSVLTLYSQVDTVCPTNVPDNFMDLAIRIIAALLFIGSSWAIIYLYRNHPDPGPDVDKFPNDYD